ncbi:hypothetical protein GUJ93_ZPchr0013g36361 [Zizania palustris]|uniref:Uncharacterized protein n=1 Tax=Zizania palustris TaxID=103762 RepID=A0A8J6BWZ7_ZIZPA|nr:hypothetical protein GUJ93_ZPchr0013g36361 [Zizania palustris]
MAVGGRAPPQPPCISATVVAPAPTPPPHGAAPPPSALHPPHSSLPLLCQHLLQASPHRRRPSPSARQLDAATSLPSSALHMALCHRRANAPLRTASCHCHPLPYTLCTVPCHRCTNAPSTRHRTTVALYPPHGVPCTVILVLKEKYAEAMDRDDDKAIAQV